MTVLAPEAARAVAAPDMSSRSGQPEGRLGPADGAVVALGALLPMVLLPGVFSPFWTPKVALLAVATGPGLIALWALARRGDRPARAAMGFLAAATLSALVSGVPRAAIAGLHEVDGGLWFVAACLACWALGRTLGARARSLLPLALVAAGVFEGVVAWAQVAWAGPAAVLAPFEGSRASATMGNPVFLGAFCAAALWPLCDLIRTSAVRSRVAAGLAAVATLAGAVQLSGSRVALLGAAVAIVGQVRALGLRRAVAVAGVAVAGIALAGLVERDTASTARLGASSDGLAVRAEVWAMGAEAWREHPLVGWGPGRFRAATSPRNRLAVARAHGPDVVLVDAHNVFVEYGVTTGLVGLALGAAFVVSAARRVRGPLAGFALVIGLTWLAQPQGVDTTTVAFLALGAAGPPTAAALWRADAWRRAAAAALAVGVIGAGVLLAGERALDIAVRTGSRGAVGRAERLLAPWATPVAVRARVEQEAARSGDTTAMARAITAARATAQRDPTRALWWSRLGDLLAISGDLDGAREAYAEAVRQNPYSVGGAIGQVALARQGIEPEVGAAATARLCALGEATLPAAVGAAIDCAARG